MTKLAEITGWLETRLPELVDTHDVPAAAVAASVGGEVVDAAAGLLTG